MKKKILLIAALILLLAPFTTFAKAKETYSSKNLIETLEAEDIELENEDYKETDKQVVVYLFRGTGCSFCRAFLKTLNELSKDYGKYFKLVSYDVWADPKNANLLEDVSKFLGQNVGGVPFIIIGDEVFPGYDAKYDDEILSAIKNQYESKEKYDVMEEMEKAQKEAERKAFFQSGTFTTMCNFVFVTLSTIIIVLTLKSESKKITKKLESLEEKSTATTYKKENVQKNRKEQKAKSDKKENKKK